MIRSLVFTFALTVVNCQMFRQYSGSFPNSFLTPPEERRVFPNQEFRYQQMSSSNINPDIRRPPPEVESFISPSRPLFRPKIPSSAGGPRLPLIPEPSFNEDRLNPFEDREIQQPIIENVALDGESLIDLGPSNAFPLFDIEEELKEKNIFVPDVASFNIEPELSLFEEEHEPVHDNEADNEISSESRIFELKTQPAEEIQNSNIGFNDENEQTLLDEEDPSTKKREIPDVDDGFEFPSFQEASNQPQLVEKSPPAVRSPFKQETNFSPQPSINYFKAPTFRPNPSRPSFDGPNESFQPQPSRHRRPVQSRPKFNLEELPLRNQQQFSPSKVQFKDEQEDKFSYNSPSYSSDQESEYVPFYESGSKKNYLYEEEEIHKPDRLSLLLLETKFNCYKRKDGYYADEELSCEVFHFCQVGIKHSWLCPNGGSFHQVHLICLPSSEDNICDKSSRFHFVNDYLYKETDESTDKEKRYVQRYYPDGYEEGIAVLEDRHTISEKKPVKFDQVKQPQLQEFQYNNETPRQIQVGLPLRQAQRTHYEEQQQRGEGTYNVQELDSRTRVNYNDGNIHDERFNLRYKEDETSAYGGPRLYHGYEEDVIRPDNSPRFNLRYREGQTPFLNSNSRARFSD